MSTGIDATSLLVARLKAIASGAEARTVAPNEEAFRALSNLAQEAQEIIDRANSDLQLVARRADEILQRYMTQIETRGSA